MPVCCADLAARHDVKLSYLFCAGGRRELTMAGIKSSQGSSSRCLRSQLWFDNPDNPAMTALYLERYLNYGLTRTELTSGKPIIGIAQTGSGMRPRHRHHLE